MNLSKIRTFRFSETKAKPFKIVDLRISENICIKKILYKFLKSGQKFSDYFRVFLTICFYYICFALNSNLLKKSGSSEALETLL